MSERDDMQHAGEDDIPPIQEPRQPAPPVNGKRSHVATYSRDRERGGYIIRVEGPHAASFAGREVPVSRKDRTEGMEKLDKLIWAGTDRESGKPVALYSFEARPKEELPQVEF